MMRVKLARLNFNVSKYLMVLLPLGLAGITFLFYLPSLWYGFMFDDLPTIVEYQHIKTFDPLSLLFANSRWISRVMHQIIYRFWGTAPMPYRIINLGMHLLISIMMFVLLVAVCKNLKKNNFLKDKAYLFASLVTGLFLLHPVQTQTVTYITQMNLEGLVVLFTFAVIVPFFFAAITTNKRLKIGLYSLSYLFTVFAAGTKEIIIVLPFLLALFDWFLISEGEWANFKKRVPLLLLNMVLLFLMVYKMGTIRPSTVVNLLSTPVHNNRGNLLTEKHEDKITSSKFFISQFKIITHYGSMFFWPFNISFDYDVKLSKKSLDIDVIFPFLLLLIIMGICLFLFVRKRNSLITFSIAWFIIAIFPRASFFPCTELVCDYKTYVGSFGMMFLIGLGLLYAIKFVYERFSYLEHPQYQALMVACLFVGLGYATKVRNIVWSSEKIFWMDCIKSAPTKARAWNNYAVAMWEGGDVKVAMDSFYKAIDCDGNYGEPHVNLAAIYQGRGENDKAFGHYEKALATGEGHPQMYFNLAMLHLGTNNQHSAEYCFIEAIKLRPVYSRAYVFLGQLYQKQNRFEKAQEWLLRGLTHDPADVELNYTYASLCHDAGRVDQAIAIFNRLDKNFMETAFLLGSCYYQKNQYVQASQYFAQAYGRDPNNLVYVYNYAQSLLNTRKYQEAIPLYEKCKARQDLYAYAPLHLARCLQEAGDKTAAASELDILIKTTPHKHVKHDALDFRSQLDPVGQQIAQQNNEKKSKINKTRKLRA
ncbi:MAG: tetratricopeptide repeat protein [bacterium]